MNETQTNTTNWLEEEAKNSTTSPTGERLPTLKLETNKITRFTVDFTNPFYKWKDGETTKAIIPVNHKGERKNIWLNTKNPLYHSIIEAGRKGQKDFAVNTVGTQKDTRYYIVEEE